ncbi:DUF6251 family protein [Streptomyces galbus]|uniref:Uncharacterized protein n=1 Tax=Streptomyces galbus TaxID=33898 RepID=A0A4V6AZN0_STRGB|nr:DUF6251 family protein [Streptomyces galbus]TKT11173.1 hypothetical protein E4U92_01415 [Streptomyces galbus]
MERLLAHRSLTVVQLPDGTHVYADPSALPFQQPNGPQIAHIHQAPPNRTAQRTHSGQVARRCRRGVRRLGGVEQRRLSAVCGRCLHSAGLEPATF